MKKNLLLLLPIFLIGIFSSSCTDDLDELTDPAKPEISLNGEANFTEIETAQGKAESVVVLNFVITSTESDLLTVLFEAGDDITDYSRDAKGKKEFTISFEAPTDKVGEFEYKITATNKDEASAVKVFTHSVKAPELDITLFNSDETEVEIDSTNDEGRMFIFADAENNYMVNVESEAGLKSISIIGDNVQIEKDLLTADTLTVYTQQLETFTLDTELLITVTDVYGNVEEVEYVILTTLGKAVEFTLGRPETANNPAENATVGIQYTSNPDANTAKFTASQNNHFVILDAPLTSKGALKEAYENAVAAGGTVEEFTAQSDANFETMYIVTKVLDVYYLVTFTDLKFDAGNNVAYFTYQK